MSPALIPSLNASAHGAIVPIAKITVPQTGNFGEYAFTNIPQNYQDLMVVINVTATNGYPYWYSNTYGSPAPSWTRLYGTGNASPVSDRAIQSGSGNVSNYSYQLLSPTAPTSAVMHILNYANTSVYKTVLIQGASDQNGAGTVSLTVTCLATTSAITLLDFATFYSGGLFTSGSSFELFGVRSIGQ
jgi:hypothetical protein